jgi:hypothetical protein
MPDTIHLKLPYLAPAQAQKHVTHNEALRRLDAIVQLAVLDTALTEPPADPDEGDRYIVAAGGTGAWDGHDGEVAAFADGAWEFAAPESGWLSYDAATEGLLLFVGDAWQGVGSYLGAFDLLGVNTAADETNRLAVRSAAVLFAGIEAGEGGTGDIRFVVNKEADGDTASLLFQSGFSGRAEVGLAGDTDFVFKVSPDGSAWTEAIRIDKDTGLPTILYDNGTSGLSAGTVQDAIDELAAGGGGGGGAVASVFGRTGAVTAAASDYDASQVDNDSSVTGAKVSEALNTLKTGVDGKLAIASNLSDLASASTARSNLGLGDAATKNTGTSAGTVAAGDDSRITGAAQKASNLSDLASASTARSNLGLGDAATKNTGTSAGTVAAGDDSRITGARQQGKETHVIPAFAWAPTITNGAGRSYEELATNKLISDTLDFDTTTQEFATAIWCPPKRYNGGTITFRVKHRLPGPSSTQTVDYALSGAFIRDDDPVDASLGTPVVVTDTFIAAGDLHVTAESGAVTLAGTYAAGCKVVLKLQRNVSTDNAAGDAKVEAVEIFWTSNAANDA